MTWNRYEKKSQKQPQATGGLNSTVENIRRFNESSATVQKGSYNNLKAKKQTSSETLNNSVRRPARRGKGL